MGELTVDAARVGVYDNHKAIAEQPELEVQIENNKVMAAVIKNFTGTITSLTNDDSNVFVVGNSEDGKLAFILLDAMYRWHMNR